jgi:hypothetical protein
MTLTEPLGGCEKCAEGGFAPRCAYCDGRLATRHEHDHMPVPLRAGGIEYVPVCINCHDLKDRTDPATWTSEEFLEALNDAPPLARIVIAKLLGDLHGFLLERDQWAA